MNIAWFLRVLLGVVSRPSFKCPLHHHLTCKGPGYRSDSIFDLSKMQPYSLSDLLKILRDLTEDFALYLPRTSDLRQLGNTVGDDKQVRAIHYCMEGASKVRESRHPMVLQL